MESGFVMFLRNQTEIKTMEGNFRDYKVKVQDILDDDEEEDGFKVTGMEAGIEQAIKGLEQMAQRVMMDQHTVNGPGMPAFFMSQEAQPILRDLQNRTNAVLEVDDDKPKQPKKKRTTFSQGGAVNFEPVSIGDGRTVNVLCSDMTSHKADALVNAANGELKHIGGLAFALLNKGGDEIQKESNGIVRNFGRVSEGEAVMTTAGRLPCRRLIHAVGPRWQGGKNNEEYTLQEAVQNSLYLATKEDFHSIAFPALSSGVFGYPVAKSTKAIVEAMKDFFDENPSSSVKIIDLIDNIMENARLFQDAVNKTWKKKKLPTQRRPIKPKPAHSGDSFDLRSWHVVNNLPEADSGRSQRETSGNQATGLTTQSGINITLVTGEIAKQSADVVFNSTTRDLRLQTGALSDAIYQAAGQVIQQECANNYPQGIKERQLAVTSGGNMSCKKIYHTYLCAWDNGAGNATAMLKDTIVVALVQAHTQNYVSMAVPAVGTGNLHFPRDVVVKTMIQAVEEFGNNYNPTTLKDIRFVVFDKDVPTVKAFQDEFKARGATVSARGAGSRQNSNVKVANRKMVVKEELFLEEAGAVGGQGAGDGASNGDSSAEGVIQFGGVRLSVQAGDITQEATDAIVNGTNPKLDLTMGGVSIAISKAGGPALINACKAAAPIEDLLAVTASGNLPCRKVIHANVQSVPNINAWKIIIKRVLEEANRQNLQSVAFPALGTGQLNINPAKMATCMMEAIVEFVKEKKESSLREVRVTIFQEHMVAIYHKEMENASAPGSKFMKWITGGFRKAGQAIKGLFSYPLTETKITSEGPTLVQREQLTFNIFSFSIRNIRDVKDGLNELCSNNSSDTSVGNDPVYGPIIKKLDQRQVELIKSLSRPYGVKIDVEQNVNRIRIRGYIINVMKAETAIKSKLSYIEKTYDKAKFAEKISKYVQWMFEDQSGGVTAYPIDMNARIEEAHENNIDLITWDEEAAGGRNITCTINLKRMTETKDGKNVKIHRKDLTAGKAELPAHWDPMPAGAKVHMTQLNSNDQEYQDVQTELFRTRQVNILKIQRIQNPGLWRRYHVSKEEVESHTSQGRQIEHKLWHGTDPGAINDINTNGFNRSYCGKNATVLGLGVYFARDAQYSIDRGYSQPDPNGHRPLFLCRVLTGTYTKGNSSYRDTPLKGDANNPQLRYDSVVDHVSNPSIYVIFRDAVVYPEYLVTFT